MNRYENTKKPKIKGRVSSSTFRFSIYNPELKLHWTWVYKKIEPVILSGPFEPGNHVLWSHLPSRFTGRFTFRLLLSYIMYNAFFLKYFLYVSIVKLSFFIRFECTVRCLRYLRDGLQLNSNYWTIFCIVRRGLFRFHQISLRWS